MKNLFLKLYELHYINQDLTQHKRKTGVHFGDAITISREDQALKSTTKAIQEFLLQIPTHI